jgi:hypothetical protein
MLLNLSRRCLRNDGILRFYWQFMPPSRALMRRAYNPVESGRRAKHMRTRRDSFVSSCQATKTLGALPRDLRDSSIVRTLWSTKDDVVGLRTRRSVQSKHNGSLSGHEPSSGQTEPVT